MNRSGGVGGNDPCDRGTVEVAAECGRGAWGLGSMKDWNAISAIPSGGVGGEQADVTGH